MRHNPTIYNLTRLFHDFRAAAYNAPTAVQSCAMLRVLAEASDEVKRGHAQDAYALLVACAPVGVVQ